MEEETRLDVKVGGEDLVDGLCPVVGGGVRHKQLNNGFWEAGTTNGVDGVGAVLADGLLAQIEEDAARLYGELLVEELDRAGHTLGHQIEGRRHHDVEGDIPLDGGHSEREGEARETTHRISGVEEVSFGWASTNRKRAEL